MFTPVLAQDPDVCTDISIEDKAVDALTEMQEQYAALVHEQDDDDLVLTVVEPDDLVDRKRDYLVELWPPRSRPSPTSSYSKSWAKPMRPTLVF